MIRFDNKMPTTTVQTTTTTNVSNNNTAAIKVDGRISFQQDRDSGDIELQRPSQEDDGSPKEYQEIPVSNTEIILSKRATSETPTPSIGELLKSSKFVLPLLISILSWSIMAMPMSIFRVTMREFGFTDRQSLTVIEFPFLSMYMPGFWSGSMIARFGTVRACQVAIACFLLGTAINLSTQDNNGTTATWFLGLIFLGIGRNFGFSSATVWVQRVYAPPHLLHLKAKGQAANEFFTFLCSGGLIFSTGYLYNNAGGGGLFGWRLLNIFIGCLILAITVVVYAAMRIEQREKEVTGRAEMAYTSRTAAVVDDDAAAVST